MTQDASRKCPRCISDQTLLAFPVCLRYSFTESKDAHCKKNWWRFLFRKYLSQQTFGFTCTRPSLKTTTSTCTLQTDVVTNSMFRLSFRLSSQAYFTLNGASLELILAEKQQGHPSCKKVDANPQLEKKIHQPRRSS